MTAILGYLVNSAVRTLLFGYFGRKIYRPGLHFSLASVAPNLRFGAWLTADSIINYLNTNLSTLVLARILGAGVAGGYNLAYNVAVVPPMKLNPSSPACCFRHLPKFRTTPKSCALTSTSCCR